MNEYEVVSLMQSSNSAEEWTRNIETVKVAFGGNYPPFWFSAILQRGVAKTTLAKFGETDEITVAS
jgi:hypothetical protein